MTAPLKSARVNSEGFYKVLKNAASPMIVLFVSDEEESQYTAAQRWAFDQVAGDKADEVIFLHVFQSEEPTLCGGWMRSGNLRSSWLVGFHRGENKAAYVLTRGASLVSQISAFVEALQGRVQYGADEAGGVA